jgi:hypothetical protein
MRKINKTQAQAKKPVAFTIQSTGAANKPKYEKPDFRSQLKDFKKSAMPQAAKPPSAKITKIEIITAEFNYTKPEPLKVEGWLLWKSVQGQLIALPDNKREDERFYPFEFIDGFVFLVDKPGSRYAYFHEHKFQQFLEKYGIHRVLRKDPNGEYQGRTDTHRNTVSVFSFVTDGKWQVSEASELRMDNEPIVQMKNASTFVTVGEATFVVFEQIAYRQDEADVEPFILRQLVSDYDIFALEAEIAEACSHLDGPDEAESESAATVE